MFAVAVTMCVIRHWQTLTMPSLLPMRLIFQLGILASNIALVIAAVRYRRVVVVRDPVTQTTTRQTLRKKETCRNIEHLVIKME